MVTISCYMQEITPHRYAYTPGLVSFGDRNILMAQLERLDMATTLDQSPSTSSDTLVLNLTKVCELYTFKNHKQYACLISCRPTQRKKKASFC